MKTSDTLPNHQADHSQVILQPSLPEAPERALALPEALPQPIPTPAAGTSPLSCLNAQEGTSQDVYESLRDHQPTRHEKLLLARTYLPLIIERFYGGNLPLPVLSWYRAHWQNFCSWHVQLDDLGLSHWININLLHLGRPLAEILRGLTHELGHEHEFLYGKPAKRPYHSKAFQNRMREIGIPCSKWGTSLGTQGPFMRFLKELAIEADTTFQEGHTTTDRTDGQSSPPGSRLKPWACKCPRARVWASIRVELSAICHKCGSTFQRQ